MIKNINFSLIIINNIKWSYPPSSYWLPYRNALTLSITQPSQPPSSNKICLYHFSLFYIAIVLEKWSCLWDILRIECHNFCTLSRFSCIFIRNINLAVTMSLNLLRLLACLKNKIIGFGIHSSISPLFQILTIGCATNTLKHFLLFFFLAEIGFSLALGICLQLIPWRKIFWL